MGHSLNPLVCMLFGWKARPSKKIVNVESLLTCVGVTDKYGTTFLVIVFIVSSSDWILIPMPRSAVWQV